MPWLCAAAIHISFSDEAGIDRERPPAMLASVSNTTSGLGPVTKKKTCLISKQKDLIAILAPNEGKWFFVWRRMTWIDGMIVSLRSS